MQNWLHYHCVIILAVYCIQLISKNRTLKTQTKRLTRKYQNKTYEQASLGQTRIRKEKELNLTRAGRIRLTNTQTF